MYNQPPGVQKKNNTVLWVVLGALGLGGCGCLIAVGAAVLFPVFSQARLAAIRTKAPVFVVVSARVGDAIEFFFEGPVPVPDTGDHRTDATAHTAALTAIIERYVRRFPEQWLWLHRRWKQ